jgi:hypothetical protein
MSDNKPEIDVRVRVTIEMDMIITTKDDSFSSAMAYARGRAGLEASEMVAKHEGPSKVLNVKIVSAVGEWSREFEQ